MVHEAVKIVVPIYGVKDESYLREVDAMVAAARAQGHNVCIVFDYHMLSPYHGVPPHLDVLGVKNQQITKSKARREQGQGFAPFGARDLWVWAREALVTMIDRWDPDYIQQGENSDIRNGWYFVAEKDHWHYNDIGGIFEQAITETMWDGIYVVEAFKVSMTKARDRYGRDGCIWVGELTAITGNGDDTGEVPLPEDDDCTVVLIENESLRLYINEVENSLAESREAHDRVEAQSLEYLNRAVQAEQALVECQETQVECVDCTEKYKDLMDANKDLIEILWSMILR